jgi:hypothetical protein
LRAIILNVRHSSTFIAAVVVAVVDVLLALGARATGLNLWADLLTGLSQASVYTGVVAAGFSAFEASRWSPSASARLRVSVRSPVAVRAVHVSAVIAPLIGGYLLALLALQIYAISTGAYGVPFAPWLIAIGAALVLAAVFGYCVGAAAGNHWYVPPAAALAFYALFVFIRVIRSSYGATSLFPAILNFDSVFASHIGTTMWGQIAFFLGLSAILVLIIRGGWRKAQRIQLSGLVALIAVPTIVGAAVVLSTNGQYTTGHNSRDFVCESTKPTICVNRGYSAALPLLEPRLHDMNSLVAGTGLTADRLEQNVEGSGDSTSQGARSLYIEQIDRDGMNFAVYRYVQKYGSATSCDQPIAGEEARLSEGYVDSWLSNYNDPWIGYGTFPGMKHLHALESLSTSEGNSWFRANYQAYMSCTLQFSDLP